MVHGDVLTESLGHVFDDDGEHADLISKEICIIEAEPVVLYLL